MLREARRWASIDAWDTLDSHMSDRTTSSRLTAVWDATDRLLEDATLAGILAHRLGPLAANRLRRLGEPVPEPLALEERAASLSMLTGIPLIERIRASCDGPLVLIKGPEIARLYPGSARRFSDIDVLSANADAVHQALLACGFLESPDPEFEFTPEHHHLQPLKWPTIGLKVEVHKYPNWCTRSRCVNIVAKCLGSSGRFSPVTVPMRRQMTESPNASE